MTNQLFKTILVPVDLGDSSGRALHFAAMFARRFRARPTVLFVDELASGYEPVAVGVIAPDGEPPEYETAVREFAAEHLQGVEHEILIKSGRPALAIVETARELHADLIAMGTHGRRGWRRALMGSVAEAVLRNAGCPVVVVPERQSHSFQSGAVTRIVCPVNFTALAREAVKHACQIAIAFLAELILVHVVEPGGEREAPPRISDHIWHWLPAEARTRSSYRELTVRGDVAERVIDCVEDLGADLIIIGTAARRIGEDAMIGSTSERLVRLAQVPVLSVPAGSTSVVSEQDDLVAKALA